MIVSLIAAVAEDFVMGSAAGGIPWNLPRDREHFRARTAGQWLLLGRRTYSEMEGWFGDHTPIILTRDPAFEPFLPSHRVVSSPVTAIDFASANGVGELFVCGGATVFAAMLPWADRLLLTRIELEVRISDPVRFPDFTAPGDWVIRHSEHWPAAGGGPSARFEVHERNGK